ncbi:amino acid ABC transporter permease [Rhizobium metallidurans]|uniref:Polar amino acid transport system permease protein n=1 Tax=Rhizobium metallidurans TaxID=1265931 RepID=A0A7W6GBV1_9HYPH|nr:amino acid ABC transporter permease [Rhizobium metallidurans]MBB3966098.1 polar amino acid transport system permease protein [Rhizobium metallidurans]
MNQTNLLATVVEWMPFVLQGFLLNILMSVLAIMIGTVVGTFLGFGQISPSAVVGVPSKLATQLFRNAPWLVLLFYCIFLMPYQITVWGATIQLPSWLRATVGFSFPVAANFSEIVRGSVNSIPGGQWEAAEALGYNRRTTLFKIILPQCFSRMLPPWMNLYALLLTATPLSMIVGVEEALGRTQAAVQAQGDSSTLIPMYLALLIMFFLYTWPINRLSLVLERRFRTK